MAIKFLNSVAVDTDVLFVDTANERVGIGTETPSSILELAGATPILTLSSTAVNVAQGIEWRNSGTLDAYIKQGPSTAEFEFNVGRNTTWGGDFKFVTDTYDAYRITKNDHRFFIVGSEKMRIDSSGNVGIGTTSPTNKLSVASPSSTSIVYGGHYSPSNQNNFFETGIDANDGYLILRNSGVVSTVKLNSDGDSYFNGGNVGIGTTSPSRSLTVNSGGEQVAALIESTSSVSSQIQIKNSNSNNGGFIKTTGNNVILTANSTGQSHLVVADGGNVGIGTTSPTQLLDVTGADAEIVIDDSNDAPALRFRGSGVTSAMVEVNSAKDMFFKTGGVAEQMRITAGGNVGIGTTSPQASLQVGSITSSVYNLATSKADFIDGNKDLSDIQMGTLNVTSTSKRSSSPFNQGYGPSITFAQNGSGYVDGYEKVIGGIKTEIKNASNQNIASVMQFYAHNNTALAPKMTIDGGTGNVGIGTTSPAYKLDVAGTGNFTGLVSGITPVNAANFVTKAYADGLTPGAGVFLPLAGGTMTGAIAMGSQNITGAGTITGTTLTGTSLDINGKATSTATITSDGSATLTTKGYVDSLITGATIYRGAWDPSGGGYGSPDLSTVTQTSGYYYICSATGTAEPNGTGTEPDTWAVGDWVIYNDVSGTGQWQKIDNSSVLSGVGTGQTVALWEGAGSVTDSETLGNAPIKLGTGTGSLIMGAGATASGENSMAIGYGSIASGDGSFAGAGKEINSTVGGQATGRNTFAFGYLAKATDDGAIAIGSQTQATATNSVALGNQAISSGINSFAAGVGNLASGNSSTSFGSVTVASGNLSFACGDNTTASGTNSFAAGKGNTASGAGSIVMGGVGTGASTAAGEASVVLGGELNTANGTNSTILGGQKNTIDINSQDSSILGGEDNEMAAGSTNSVILGGIGLLGGGTHQTICGVANISKNNCKFIVGVGTYTSPTSISRENGLEVRDSGQLVLGKYTGTNFNPVATNSNDLLSVNATGDVQQSRTLPRGIKVGPDTISGTIAANAGAIRYREDGNNSYVDMIMKVSAFNYAWVNIVQNSWT